MYVIVGKQNCIQCDEFKNLLDEKGIQYKYLDIKEMPKETMTYLRMHWNSFPIVLNLNHFPIVLSLNNSFPSNNDT